MSSSDERFGDSTVRLSPSKSNGVKYFIFTCPDFWTTAHNPSKMCYGERSMRDDRILSPKRHWLLLAKAPNTAWRALMISGETDKAEDDFMDVIIKADTAAQKKIDETGASSYQSSTKASAFLVSAAKSKSSQSATNRSDGLSINSNIEIGFRAKKVSIERGGWFNPNVFKLSKNYYRLTDTLASGGITKDQVRNANSESDLKKLLSYKLPGETNLTSYAFPAFPTGFVIAKDITIRIEMSETEQRDSKSYMEKKSSSNVSCFCFSSGSASSESRTSETAYSGSSDKFFYIRIPGPQIAGWFLEFTSADNSEPYEKLDPEMYAVALKELINKEDANV
ncbi:hypothetical protein LJC34_05950 [Oscillospiraceae bacterium OttesenSCG-928-G22]|nr:hypothetical protein [Oscillospiraceae bacterium OttesenSCG-928-G22]